MNIYVYFENKMGLRDNFIPMLFKAINRSNVFPGSKNINSYLQDP